MTGRSEAAFEKRDASAGRIVIFGATVAAGLIVSFAFVGWLVYTFQPAPSESRSEIKEGIRLQVAPAEERLRLQERAAARLSGYGWIDASAGRVHIPIGKAMRLLAESGWPEEVAEKPRKDVP